MGIQIDIRKETEADFESVYQLNQAAFNQESEARLVELLRKSDAFVEELSLVALHDDKIAGHILFSRIRIRNDETENESLALAPMAVNPEFQRQGIGSHLITAGLEKARLLGYKSVIVLGHEHYYPKFGFLPAEKWNIRAPFDVPSEVFMAIELTENALKKISGTVEYDEAFSEV